MKMKKNLFLIFISLLGISLSGAKGPNGQFEEWGKVTMDELKMTECSFEKNADAVFLLDLAQVYYRESDPDYFTNGKFRITTSYYQRVKVFTQKGTRRANHKVTLRISSKEEVKNVRGVCYNLIGGDIKRSNLDQEDVHTTKLNEYETQVSFTVPGVTEGSVFEMGYEREQDVSYTLPQWSFTSDIPSVKSSLTVGFLNAISYYVDKNIVTDSIEEEYHPFTSDIKVISSNGFTREALEGKAITYTTHNLKAFHLEPYTNSSRNYTNWIGFQLKGFSYPLTPNNKLVSSFNKLIDMLYDDPLFAANLESEPVPQKLWRSLINDTMSQVARGRAIYEYIRSNVKWNGNGGIKSQVANGKTWKNKTGSRTDINLLLLSTLRSTNILAYPVLISSRYRGVTNTSYPILDEYVGVDVLMVSEKGQNLILDATNKVAPFGEPSLDQLNTRGLVIKGRDDFFWQNIHAGMPSKQNVVINASLSDSGFIQGTIDILYTNYKAMEMTKLKHLSAVKPLNDYIKTQLPNITIESVTDTIMSDQCYFMQKIKFSMQAITDNDGNIYVSVASLFGNNLNPFVNKERIADIDFGHWDKYSVSLLLSVPPSYTVDSLMKPVSLRTDDTSAVFLSEVEYLTGTLSWQQRLDYLRSFYKARDYPAFFDFENKYYDIRQRPVVLRKKI